MESQALVQEILKLDANERASVVEQILTSLDAPDATIDEKWRVEVEERFKAYDEGIIKSVSLDEAVAKILK